MVILPSDARVERDQVVLITIKIGPFDVMAPCRIVDVVDEASRYAFAYGTLPSHPECGEELFDVTLSDDGTVTFTVTAFSKPATFLPKVGALIARLVQLRATRRFLDALSSYVVNR